jgi:Family of unknown function (DUF5996)
MADKDLLHHADRTRTWPSLPLDEWQDTYATLHMWTQVVGKIRLAQSPMVNHWWQVPLYVTARGLTTSSIPYGSEAFQIDFDFVDHRLTIASSAGGEQNLALVPRTVADFYHELFSALRSLGIEVHIWTTPVEVPDVIPFEKDRVHAAYDADYAHRCWRILLQADRVFKAFRGRFLGKSSPVHFFWGGFDLAVTRFSGRQAPAYAGAAPNVGPHVMHESYSHEVISAGFWPGDGRLPYPAFYAYAVPEPAGFRGARVRPEDAFYSGELGLFILPYDAVRTAERPDEMLLEFMQSTYDTGANLGKWDRHALEERPGWVRGADGPRKAAGTSTA